MAVGTVRERLSPSKTLVIVSVVQYSAVCHVISEMAPDACTCLMPHHAFVNVEACIHIYQKTHSCAVEKSFGYVGELICISRSTDSCTFGY